MYTRFWITKKFPPFFLFDVNCAGITGFVPAQAIPTYIWIFLMVLFNTFTSTI